MARRISPCTFGKVSGLVATSDTASRFPPRPLAGQLDGHSPPFAKVLLDLVPGSGAGRIRLVLSKPAIELGNLLRRERRLRAALASPGSDQLGGHWTTETPMAKHPVAKLVEPPLKRTTFTIEGLRRDRPNGTIRRSRLVPLPYEQRPRRFVPVAH